MKIPSLTSLKSSLAAIIAGAILTGCASGPSGNPGITSASGAKVPKKANLLFVQNAASVSFDKKKDRLTLHGVNPVTIAFSDRPERFAGHMPTKNFVPMWSQGKDSFLKDPPNATLSVLDNKNVTSLVMVLRNPKLSGGDLSYDVQVLEGTPPKHAGSASLFIDIIGMPLTPFSFAGAARRSVAYGAYGCGGPYGATVVHYGTPAAYYGGTAAYRGAAVGYRGTAAWSNGSGSAYGYRGGDAHWNDGSGSAEGWRGSTASWNNGSGSAQGFRGGSASWGGGSGSAQGWRGNSVSWSRR